jgi:tetratricopeptide (TPR) repeat protein
MARRWLATILCAAVASCVAPAQEASGVQALTAGYDQALQKLDAAGRQKTQREAQRQAAGAVADLQAVVERRPDFAPALAALAEARLVVALQDRDARRQARSLAERALAISGTQARAHSAIAWLHFFEDRRFTDARRGFERALSLDPGLVFARFGYGLLLASQGEFDRALREVERAERSGLVRPNWRMGSQAVLFFARRYKAAVRRARAPLEGSPAPGPDHFWAGTALLAAGDAGGAVTALEERVRETNRIPGSVAALAIAYARGGRTEQARALLPEIRGHLRRVEESGRRPCAENPCYLFALVDLALGDKAAALEMLERAVADEPPGIWNVWLKVDPRMDPLRGHPRFVEILSRAGFR